VAGVTEIGLFEVGGWIGFGMDGMAEITGDISRFMSAHIPEGERF